MESSFPNVIFQSIFCKTLCLCLKNYKHYCFINSEYEHQLGAEESGESDDCLGVQTRGCLIRYQIDTLTFEILLS